MTEKVENSSTGKESKQKKEKKGSFFGSPLTITKKIMCGGFVIGAITISIIMLAVGYSPRTRALSAIGEDYRWLFFAWGVCTASATYLNLKLLATRLQVKNRIFDIFLLVGCSMGIVTVLILGMDPIIRAIHVSSAMLFGVITALCLVFLLFIKVRRKNKRTSLPYITAIALAAVIFAFTSIQVGWFTALTQVLLANICLIIMFISNFLERWPAELPARK